MSQLYFTATKSGGRGHVVEMRKAIKLNRGKINRQKHLLQLTLEQCGFELRKFTYTWIFFSEYV